jgi:hypothetical protein
MLMSMSGYTKLFNSILASTIWREDDKTRLVWITLLAMADKNGIAEGSIPGIADMARVKVDDCRKALKKLQAPDADSRSDEFGGRRIQPVEGGFLLLNHGKYRAKLSADERREYLRQKQAEYRRKHPSTKVSDKSTLSTHTEAEAEAEAEKDQDQDQNQSAAPTIQYTEANTKALYLIAREIVNSYDFKQDDYVEELKVRAAKARLPYNSSLVNAAVTAAMAAPRG